MVEFKATKRTISNGTADTPKEPEKLSNKSVKPSNESEITAGPSNSGQQEECTNINRADFKKVKNFKVLYLKLAKMFINFCDRFYSLFRSSLAIFWWSVIIMK